MPDTETYLGDDVYVEFDGLHIWLRSNDGNDNQIALKPKVFDALVEYVNAMRAQIKRANAALEND